MVSIELDLVGEAGQPLKRYSFRTTDESARGLNILKGQVVEFMFHFGYSLSDLRSVKASRYDGTRGVPPPEIVRVGQEYAIFCSRKL